DEMIGETGIAHMLEHMLFKPTLRDTTLGSASGAMKFERDTGCILNANTWKDRTTYFFNYPRSYFSHALAIEADRMNNVILSDKEFQPERNNVLSEFDMYFGDPMFALTTTLIGSAYHAHQYGHETIGFREDIESYTVEKLQQFYSNYYRPDNATLIVIGDIELGKALSTITDHFGKIDNPTTSIPRIHAREPKQEGIRRSNITRTSNANLLAIGVKHDAFPTAEWLETMILFDVLCGRSDSVLHKLLVDTGLASKVEYMIEPTSEPNLGIIYISLAQNVNHAEIEKKVLQCVRSLTTTDIVKDTKKAIQSECTEIVFVRDNSIRLAMALTEYASAGNWEEFTNLKNTLSNITSRKLLGRAKKLFRDSNLTIGTFIGTT
ncbi:MAG: pitrilysin family protein, partial [Candidatus Paceibacterota bacterium]